MKKALALVIIGVGVSLAGCTHYPMSHHDRIVKGALIGGVVGGVVGAVASGGNAGGIVVGAASALRPARRSLRPQPLTERLGSRARPGPRERSRPALDASAGFSRAVVFSPAPGRLLS